MNESRLGIPILFGRDVIAIIMAGACGSDSVRRPRGELHATK